MNKQTLVDVIGILGLILVPTGFIATLHPYIRYPSLLIGVVIIGLHLKYNYDAKLKNIKKEISELKEENQKTMEILKEKTSKIEGWKEAAEHFWFNKKAQIDPFLLIILVILLVIFVVLMQKFS